MAHNAYSNLNTEIQPVILLYPVSSSVSDRDFAGFKSSILASSTNVQLSMTGSQGTVTICHSGVEVYCLPTAGSLSHRNADPFTNGPQSPSVLYSDKKMTSI